MKTENSSEREMNFGSRDGVIQMSSDDANGDVLQGNTKDDSLWNDLHMALSALVMKTLNFYVLPKFGYVTESIVAGKVYSAP